MRHIMQPGSPPGLEPCALDTSDRTARTLRRTWTACRGPAGGQLRALWRSSVRFASVEQPGRGEDGRRSMVGPYLPTLEPLEPDASNPLPMSPLPWADEGRVLPGTFAPAWVPRSGRRDSRTIPVASIRGRCHYLRVSSLIGTPCRLVRQFGVSARSGDPERRRVGFELSTWTWGNHGR